MCDLFCIFKVPPLRLDEDTYTQINSTCIYNFCKRVFAYLGIHMTDVDFVIINAILNTYNNLPFHNLYHVLDVMHLAAILLRQWNHYASMNKHEKKLFLFIAIGHDAGHDGRTNSEHALMFESNHSYDDLQSKTIDLHESYDGSVTSDTGSYNEKMHTDLLCSILRKNKCSTTSLNIHKFILMTDLRQQESFLHAMEKNREWEQILILKLADVGHVLRPRKVHTRFVNALLMETYKPFNRIEKAQDTIKFNETIVHPLLKQYESCCVNSSELFTAYEEQINGWKFKINVE